MAASIEQANVNSYTVLDSSHQIYEQFDSYAWNLDAGFLSGLVQALGGPDALSRTATQANIVLDARSFYHERKTGVLIPLGRYRQWLYHRKEQPLWDWLLLEALCQRRDEARGQTTVDDEGQNSQTGEHGANKDSDGAQEAQTALEKEKWIRDLGQPQPQPTTAQEEATQAQAQAQPTTNELANRPSWQYTTSLQDLFIPHSPTPDKSANPSLSPQGPPNSKQFAALSQAIARGEKLDGGIEVPNFLVRKPHLTPHGKMAPRKKPWENGVQHVARSVGGEADVTSSHHQNLPEGRYLDDAFPPLTDEEKGSCNASDA